MSQQQKEKPKRAFRELPIQIIKNKEQGWQEDNGIYLKVVNLDYKDEQLTEKQLKQIARQIESKIENMRFVISSAIRCPNCEHQLDEIDDKPNHYHCDECNVKINMEFQK